MLGWHKFTESHFKIFALLADDKSNNHRTPFRLSEGHLKIHAEAQAISSSGGINVHSPVLYSVRMAVRKPIGWRKRCRKWFSQIIAVNQCLGGGKVIAGKALKPLHCKRCTCRKRVGI